MAAAIQLNIQHSQTLAYRPAIDGLRGIAVLAVLAYHLNHALLPSGFIGVDIFFVISGYLITSVLSGTHGHAPLQLTEFYQRRIARLVPAFFTVAITTLFVACFVYSSQDLASCGANLAAASLSVANIKLLLQGSYFTVSHDAQPFLHYWSLSVEEQFYFIFPLFFLLLSKSGARIRTIVLAAGWLGSFSMSIILTRIQPDWAFYLLPTRAWELLTGALLAVGSRATAKPLSASLCNFLSLFGVATILISLTFIDADKFPGYLTALPVLGAAFLILPNRGPVPPTQPLLSWTPLVAVGKASYSLYLWHWPIFSFVDYHLYLSSPLVRVVLKLSLTAGATIIGFLLIEKPARAFLNRTSSRSLAFSFLGFVLILSVSLGLFVRQKNYIVANAGDVARGGIAFHSENKPSVVLMGDSNASMYAKSVREISDERHFSLNVISVDGGDPLPHSSGATSPVWDSSLNFIRQKKPDVLILACHWSDKLSSDRQRLSLAIADLQPYVGRFVILTQPPQRPEEASRERIREGSRPPFREDSGEQVTRISTSSYIKALAQGKVLVVDLDPFFFNKDGSLSVSDAHGREYYHDSTHLSGLGAERVKPALEHSIVSSGTYSVARTTE